MNSADFSIKGAAQREDTGVSFLGAARRKSSQASAHESTEKDTVKESVEEQDQEEAQVAGSEEATQVGAPQADRREYNRSADETSPLEEGEEREKSFDPYDDAQAKGQPPLPEEEAPPLPEEEAPPLPDEAPEDDGWDAVYSPDYDAYYFTNRFSGKSQWTNPRAPDDNNSYGVAPGTETHYGAPGTSSQAAPPTSPPRTAYLGYNPKIHGDYDPNADYAKYHETAPQEEQAASQTIGQNPFVTYEQQGTFNRFSGTFQNPNRGAEYHNDENKSNRQLNAYFDVGRAANQHDGRSLKAERSNKKPTKKEVKEYNEQRRARKDQKRREFLLS